MQRPISILRWFQPINLTKYPHFNVADALVWDSFMRSDSKEFIRFAYDVPLIKESLRLGPAIPYLVDDWDYLTAFKIDAIGESLDNLHLFEVKQSFEFSAIGQILTYFHLFSKCYYGFKPLIMNIVCSSVDFEMIVVCKALQINVFEILV
jgi:hypothetical protein